MTEFYMLIYVVEIFIYYRGACFWTAGAGEAKKALYHCNYCIKDISGTIRIKCNKCPDFDLCVECFSVGVEITPHKSNHSYRVIVIPPCTQTRNCINVATFCNFASSVRFAATYLLEIALPETDVGKELELLMSYCFCV